MATVQVQACAALASWLDTATRKLSTESAARVRDEIQQHFESACEDALVAGATIDDSCRSALDSLGDAKAVNRHYRREKWGWIPMSSQTSPHRPQSVRWAVACLWMCLGVFVLMFWRLGLQGALNDVPILGILSPFVFHALLAWRINVGRGWARWLYSAYCGYMLLVVPFLPQSSSFDSTATPERLIENLYYLLLTVAFVLLFTSTSRQWFGAMAAVPKPSAGAPSLPEDQLALLRAEAGEDARVFATMSQDSTAWTCICGTRSPLDQSKAIQNCKGCHRNRDHAIEHYSEEAFRPSIAVPAS